MEKNLDFSIIDDFKVSFLKTDNKISSALKEGKMWEEWLVNHISNFYKKNTNMIDIGGFIGTSCLQMSKHISKNNQIYVFEPIYFDILEKNIRDNHLESNVTLFKCGLSNEELEFKTFDVDTDKSMDYGFSVIQNNQIVIEHQLNQSDKIKSIQLKTLDSYGLEDISLINIDAGNMEHKILEGAVETIQKYNPVILIRLWSTSSNSMEKYRKGLFIPYNVYESFTLLSQLGYVSIPINPENDTFMFIHLSKCKIKIEN